MVKITSAKAYKPLTSHRFLKSMASGGLARYIMLEAFVETGRTFQAYKRGGFDEGRERITEEFLGALFWMGGVKAFNAVNDRIGKWILGFKTAVFDIGNDSARNPLLNFLHNETSTRTGKAFTERQIAKFKSTKLITSILLANAMIGFAVPKLNQKITRYYHKNDALPQSTQEQISSPLTSVCMDEFLSDSKINKKAVSFGTSSPLLKLAFNLENNTSWQLLSTDIGTASGRTISARNNDERREILFRDLSSIYFYMFNMPNMNKWLNELEQKDRRPARVDSINVAYTKDLMADIVKENGGKISGDKLAEEMLGDMDFKLPDNIKAKFKDGYMPLDEFKKLIASVKPGEDITRFTKTAEDMAKLQPEVANVSRITVEQAERVFKGGYLNNPEFLKNLYELSFGKNKKGLPNFLNPYKFISVKSFQQVDDDLKFFVSEIIRKAKETGKDISAEMLEQALKRNFRMNLFNWGSGFTVSALFLSTLIPKIQYWITKKMTGTNDFPGTEEYRKPGTY